MRVKVNTTKFSPKTGKGFFNKGTVHTVNEAGGPFPPYGDKFGYFVDPPDDGIVWYTKGALLFVNEVDPILQLRLRLKE